MAQLRTLRIRNLVILEDLAVEFGPGLNLLTGETGAGKSILVDALALVAGARADRGLVRGQAAKATVEALFEIAPRSGAARWLENFSGEATEAQATELLIRREVAADGGGRVLVNGSPCTVALLRELAGHLLELHGQHDPKELLEADHHLELLDAFAGHLAALERTRAAHAAVREQQARLAELSERAADRDERESRLAELVREIRALGPRPGEIDELERERRVLRHAGRLAELLERTLGAVYEGEPSASALAAVAARHAAELAAIDPGLEESAKRLHAAAVELDDLAVGLRRYRDGKDFDPGRLEEVEARRAALERAALRYAADEAGLLARAAEAEQQLSGLAALDQDLAAAERELEQTCAHYVAAALELGRGREAAASKLERAVGRQLAALALAQARFEVRLVSRRGEEVRGAKGATLPLAALGAERAEFQLAANPGEPLRALRQVASGGELSRVMLALHVSRGVTGTARTQADERAIVFDEIDAGIGGAVADAVGARLSRLAERRQVLCVTHLPQIAAYADRHFRVSKQVASGRTRADIVDLEGSARVDELARMLGGKRATPASRRHASELLEGAGREAPARE